MRNYIIHVHIWVDRCNYKATRLSFSYFMGHCGASRRHLFSDGLPWTPVHQSYLLCRGLFSIWSWRTLFHPLIALRLCTFSIGHYLLYDLTHHICGVPDVMLDSLVSVTWANCHASCLLLGFYRQFPAPFLGCCCRFLYFYSRWNDGMTINRKAGTNARNCLGSSAFEKGDSVW